MDGERILSSNKEKILEEAYRKVLDNTIFIEKTISRSKKLRILLYNLFLIFLAPYIDEITPVVHVINGKAEFRTRHFMGSAELYYGLTFSSINDFVSQRKHVSYLKRIKRIGVLVNSFFSYFRLPKFKGCFSYWLDFCLWNEYLEKQKPTILISNGHYDRLTTTLSELCYICSVDFQMKQHGLLPNTYDIPHRIRCSKVYAFDSIQEKIFKNYIIANNDCIYESWYQSGLTFLESTFSNYTVGIIENRSDEIQEIYAILRCISNTLKKGEDVTVMLHPLSKADDYKDNVNGCSCNITFTRDKYLNYDLLISTPSTLAYDYLREGYKNPIILADFKHKMKDVFSDYSNVIYVDSEELLNEKVINITAK